MDVAREHISHAVEDYIEATTSVQIYGEPNEAVLEMIRQLSQPGVLVTVKKLRGFNRLQGASKSVSKVG
jgi:hypothetical protein